MGYVLSLEAITRVSKELGKSNKIVYTHGAYDLFHAGHLDFLRKSKECGQILIVGVDSDELISTYKSVTRPVIRLKERLEIISKLDFIDFAFPLQVIPSMIPKYNKNPHQYYFNLYKEISVPYYLWKKVCRKRYY
jgi:D-beta-D-heptose 7-phosphate kinase/D-beta-D-heptose 1-phosphate adenosyltransferase